MIVIIIIMSLPLEIFQLISNYADVIIKFRILSTCRYINDNVYINTLYDILYVIYNINVGFHICECPAVINKLTSELLIKHAHIAELNIANNYNINDKNIKNLK